MKNILIASDHAGFKLKEIIISFLKDNNYNILNLGCFNEDLVDYPDYANELCKNINEDNIGILICGTGIGMSIAANRFKHIRGALCINSLMAKLAREHNNANVLILGARIIDEGTALACLKEFLNTDFTKDKKHQRRIDKL